MKELQELRNYILNLKNTDVIKKTTEITILHKLNAIEKQLTIPVVSNQRETFNALFVYLDDLSESEYDNKSITEHIEDYLKSI